MDTYTFSTKMLFTFNAQKPYFDEKIRLHRKISCLLIAQIQ